MSRSTPRPTDPAHAGGATCADASSGGRSAASRLESGVQPGFPPIFPPADADVMTRRRWLATTPWPEVVFASAH
ncbi:MAG: hypothetical protein GXY39_13410 [Actinomycetales bacterium]|nr:hypothetical protein [Tetrasphaera sp.]NLX00683.1 hypothetical protein [Actinomycetales bacterium]